LLSAGITAAGASRATRVAGEILYRNIMADNIAVTASQPQQSPRRCRWRELGVHTYVRIFVIAALLYYLFRRETGSIVYRWVSDSSWSHGFLIPLFSIYFLNQRRDIILNLRTRPNYAGLLFLLCTILFYFFNVLSPSGYAYFRNISIVAALGSVVLFLGGWPLLRQTWLAVAFLIFAIPLPARFYRAVTIPMRQLAAGVAAGLLNLVADLQATAHGVIIDIIYKGQPLVPGLDVAEACSGMRLLMAFLALGVAMAYLHYRPVWQRLILLASTVPIAIFCNIVRVTVTGFIYVLLNPKYAQGIYHDMLGMLMLPLAFGLYGALGWFMSELFVEEKGPQPPDVVVRRR